jgi:hypothetical protein
MRPSGPIKIVFIARYGGGNDVPFMAKNLDTAEVVFMTCGLSPERAAALRIELEHNKVASVETSIDDAVAAKFRYARL